MTTKPDYTFKILLIGDANVGKSALMWRYAVPTREFTRHYIRTIGITFKSRTIELQGKTVKLQIWDTADQQRLKNISSSLYRGAHGVLGVYDVTMQNSFDNIKQSLNEIECYGLQVNKVLLGNKLDLQTDPRIVETAVAQEFANLHSMPFYETSARTSYNVEQAFITLATEMKRRVDAERKSEDAQRMTTLINYSLQLLPIVVTIFGIALTGSSFLPKDSALYYLSCLVLFGSLGASFAFTVSSLYLMFQLARLGIL